MPWWFWLLLWIVIILASLILYAWLGWRLFRQGRALVRDASRQVERFTALADDLRSSTSTFNKDQFQAEGLERSGIYLPVASAQARYVEGKNERREARRIARIQRKLTRNQPQSLRDLKHL